MGWNVCGIQKIVLLLHALLRDVAQSGLEYSSGGRVVAGSNPVIPTTETTKGLRLGLDLFLCCNQPP